MKKLFKSAAAVAVPLSMCLFGSVTASAAPVDTTEEIISEEVSETSAAESAAVTTVPESETPESVLTGAPVTTAAVTTTAFENPYEDGMLADDELFKFITDYLNDGISLDTDGTGVLIGEDILNPGGGESDEAEDGDDTETAENKSGALTDYYSGEKLMYTVATRDGNIFYIIIDKSGVGENVYFLNSVDFTDLAALVDTEKETLSKAEKEILNAADENVGTSDDETEGDETDNADNGTVGESSKTDNTAQTSSGGSNTLYIVLGIAAVGVIGVAAYFKVGPGKKKMAAKAAFDDEDDEDENDDGEEEYYNEDEEEPQEQSEQPQEKPQEDSYEESYEEE